MEIWKHYHCLNQPSICERTLFHSVAGAQAKYNQGNGSNWSNSMAWIWATIVIVHVVSNTWHSRCIFSVYRSCQASHSFCHALRNWANNFISRLMKCFRLHFLCCIEDMLFLHFVVNMGAVLYRSIDTVEKLISISLFPSLPRNVQIRIWCWPLDEADICHYVKFQAMQLIRSRCADVKRSIQSQTAKRLNHDRDAMLPKDVTKFIAYRWLYFGCFQ